ncbi:MAG: thioredoxin [Candidatus Daviesbacteria bacterium]
MVKILDFWAPWCGPCLMMKPIIEEIEKELKDKIKVVEINVDEKPDEATKYEVMSIPTFIVLKDEKEVGRKIGVTTKSELLKLINS